MDTLDLVYDTLRYAHSKGAEWETMTRLQLDLKAWAEED